MKGSTKHTTGMSGSSRFQGPRPVRVYLLKQRPDCTPRLSVEHLYAFSPLISKRLYEACTTNLSAFYTLEY